MNLETNRELVSEAEQFGVSVSAQNSETANEVHTTTSLESDPNSISASRGKDVNALEHAVSPEFGQDAAAIFERLNIQLAEMLSGDGMPQERSELLKTLSMLAANLRSVRKARTPGEAMKEALLALSLAEQKLRPERGVNTIERLVIVRGNICNAIYAKLKNTFSRAECDAMFGDISDIIMHADSSLDDFEKHITVTTEEEYGVATITLENPTGFNLDQIPDFRSSDLRKVFAERGETGDLPPTQNMPNTPPLGSDSRSESLPRGIEWFTRQGIDIQTTENGDGKTTKVILTYKKSVPNTNGLQS